jgi:hypothetical protein
MEAFMKRWTYLVLAAALVVSACGAGNPPDTKFGRTGASKTGASISR